ncbi:hypothetical protein HZH66_002556 [Vespula vulgaris]|uniref:dolichyl-P-Glc:Man9GlcNAc2-PP-dolichol alpha-1,3-glucosyltransferase n=1 Tax=Vespula vulgaris TaxID=7454 RepID=A0A834NHG3_VESVU|nr:hypothetical protein HZH66_002556 [Vespula vulgaris]
MPYTEEYIKNKLTTKLNASHVCEHITSLLKWCVTYHSHSGQEKPPMYGDYEAQRHWQEITLNLPIEKWYVNTTDNDLEYWGLDYPPLTAYHSLLLGYIANATNPSYVKLHKSRGISSSDHKYFMRMTVLCSDAMIFLPTMIWYVMSLQTIKTARAEYNNLFGFEKKDFILLSALIYPGIILIDHGHFQYNCVSLGFFVAAVTAILNNSFISIIITFTIIWLPFLKDWNTFLHTILRLFPFNRGVFEDKVANVWCTINVLYKLRNIFTNEQLAQICLVHEKSILLVAIPVLLHFHNDPLACFWLLLISHFTTVNFDLLSNLCLNNEYKSSFGSRFEALVPEFSCTRIISYSYCKWYIRVTYKIVKSSEVTDLSDGCGAKFSVVVISDIFEGKPLLQRHRLVNSALEEELKTIHAFSQKTLTSEQWKKQQT